MYVYVTMKFVKCHIKVSMILQKKKKKSHHMSHVDLELTWTSFYVGDYIPWVSMINQCLQNL